jgi:hypothetical protein
LLVDKNYITDFIHYLCIVKINCNKMSKKLFIEKREQGDFAIRKPNSERASDVKPTQKEAIKRARELNPNSPPLVERVRHTKDGNPDNGANHNFVVFQFIFQN